jgi:hypothetical protein
MRQLVDLSTILAAVAGLWALAMAWWTYVESVREHNQDIYDGLKSVLRGLRSELDFMKYWSGSYSTGYPQKQKIQDSPADWSYPSRLIWAFPYETIKGLPQSPYAFHMRELIGPFLKLSFSISKLLQFYAEYRKYILAQPELYHFFKLRKLSDANTPLSPQQKEYADIARDFNYRIHVGAIGGEDSTDEECLYKAHRRAFETLNTFEAALRKPSTPWLFWLGHAFSLLFFLIGLYLFVRLVRTL